MWNTRFVVFLKSSFILALEIFQFCYFCFRFCWLKYMIGIFADVNTQPRKYDTWDWDGDAKSLFPD